MDPPRRPAHAAHRLAGTRPRHGAHPPVAHRRRRRLAHRTRHGGAPRLPADTLGVSHAHRFLGPDGHAAVFAGDHPRRDLAGPVCRAGRRATAGPSLPRRLVGRGRTPCAQTWHRKLHHHRPLPRPHGGHGGLVRAPAKGHRGLFPCRPTGAVVGGLVEYLCHAAQFDHVHGRTGQGLRHQLDLHRGQRRLAAARADRDSLLPAVFSAARCDFGLRIPRAPVQPPGAALRERGLCPVPVRTHGDRHLSALARALCRDGVERLPLHRADRRPVRGLHGLRRHGGGHLDRRGPGCGPARCRYPQPVPHRDAGRRRPGRSVDRGGRLRQTAGVRLALGCHGRRRLGHCHRQPLQQPHALHSGSDGGAALHGDAQ